MLEELSNQTSAGKRDVVPLDVSHEPDGLDCCGLRVRLPRSSCLQDSSLHDFELVHCELVSTLIHQYRCVFAIGSLS